jgi:hypothetical protein
MLFWRRPTTSHRHLPLSRRQYLIVRALFWVYTVLWVMAAIYVPQWHLPLWVKVVIGGLIVVGTPSIDDLIASYSKYLRTFDDVRRSVR